MKAKAPFEREADLVQAFCASVEESNARGRAPKWTVYHETAGWDLLLVSETGSQIGIEAKLSLNAKVLEQALPDHWSEDRGPDYRAVLVPRGGLQNHLVAIAGHLGITVLVMNSYDRMGVRWTHDFRPALPDEASRYALNDWHPWQPADREHLPDYVPDVVGGKAAPVMLTDWKVRAIKLVILLDRRGVVTRKDMKALAISPSRWTAAYHGFLVAGEGGYVRCRRTPDFKAQHPENYAQIEADFDTWAAALAPAVPA